MSILPEEDILAIKSILVDALSSIEASDNFDVCSFEKVVIKLRDIFDANVDTFKDFDGINEFDLLLGICEKYRQTLSHEITGLI